MTLRGIIRATRLRPPLSEGGGSRACGTEVHSAWPRIFSINLTVRPPRGILAAMLTAR